MKNIKSIISFILTLSMIFQLVPVFAVTDTADTMLNITFNDMATNTVNINDMTVIGGKVKVVETSASNKALHMRNSTMQTSVSFKGIPAASENTVFSVAVKADNIPANLSIGSLADPTKTMTETQVFLKIVNNAI